MSPIVIISIVGSVVVLIVWSAAARKARVPIPNNPTMEDVKRLIQEKQKIAAIVCYRKLHPGCGLADAKKAVEELTNRSNPHLH